MQDFNPDDFNPEDNSPDYGNTYSTGCVAGCADELANCIRRRPSRTDCKQEYQDCSFGCNRNRVRDSDP